MLIRNCIKLKKQLTIGKSFLFSRCLHIPCIVFVPLRLEQQEQFIFLSKHAKHWRERQYVQAILWLSKGGVS